MSVMQMVYQAGLNNGLSANQARAFTAEVGRENDYNPDYIFGEHRDSQRDNVGIISWNQGRRDNLYAFLKKKGVKVNGRQIERSQRALDAQMQFAIQEMKTNPSYKMTKKLFLGNPNVSYRTAEKVLGKNFIRWDYAGNSLGAKVKDHHAKRDKYYSQLGGVVGEAQQQVPQPLGTDWSAFKSKLEGSQSELQPKPLGTDWTAFKSSIDGEQPIPQPEPLGTDWNAFKSSLEGDSAPVSPQTIQPLGTDWNSFKQSIETQEPSQPDIEAQPNIIGGNYGSRI